jgi:hypothetical protein
LIDSALAEVVQPLRLTRLRLGEAAAATTHPAAGSGSSEPRLRADDEQFSFHRGDRADDGEDESPGRGAGVDPEVQDAQPDLMLIQVVE